MNRSSCLLPLALCVPAAAAAPQGAQFGPSTNFVSGTFSDFEPYDVDLDGDPDVLGVTVGGFGVLGSVENLGDGTYGTAQALSGQVLSNSVMELADLTGDGHLDVIVAEGNGELTWFEFLGPNQFSAPAVLQNVANGANEFTMADVDGDGDADIVAVSTFGDRIEWFENEGGASFAAPVVVTTAVDGPIGVKAADLDGDGDLDLASISRYDDRLAWYPNLGGGAFGSQRIVSSAADEPLQLAVADLNGDGVLDLLTASDGDDEVAWYRGTGGGNFATQVVIGTPGGGVNHVGAADVDMDGLLDVYASSLQSGSQDIRWYQNLGFGFFGPAQAVNGAVDSAGEIRVYDADEDSDVDFVFVTGYTPQLTDIGSVYCTSNPNSTGVNGQLQITGTDLRALNAVSLVATELPPNTFGIFATSRTADNVVGPGGSAGVLCLGGAIGRYQGLNQVLFTGVGGAFRLTLDLDAMAQPNGTVAALAGQTWRFQAWHRDVTGGGVTSNFTDAASVTLR